MDRYRQLRLRLDEAPTQGEAVKPQGPAGRPSRPTAPSDRTSHGMQDTTLMEQVVARMNLMKALVHMERKEESAPGIDGMTVPELRPFLKANWPTIKEKLLQGTYEPQPVKRVEIPKTWQRVRERIRDITDRNNSQSMSWRIERLPQYLEGPLGYFHISDANKRLQRLGEWMRRRLRMCTWNQWKRMRTRVRKLRGFGLDEDDVWNLSRSRKGPVLAKTHQLHQALNARYWNGQGLIDLLVTYQTYR